MNYLFSRAGRARLAHFLGHGALVAFDFDGTLAPIVVDRRAARMGRAVGQALRKLGRVQPLAIITGRSLADLRPRVPGVNATLVGNHGLEGLELRAADTARSTVRAWDRALAQRKLPPGVELENKVWSLSLHYRRARPRLGALRELYAIAQELKPAPRIVPGKFVLNLMPRHSPDKGDALLELVRRTGMRRAVFIGDDYTDEDAFQLGSARVLSIRIGRKRGSSAEFYLKEQAEVVDLLELVRRLVTVGGEARRRASRKSSPASYGKYRRGGGRPSRSPRRGTGSSSLRGSRARKSDRY